MASMSYCRWRNIREDLRDAMEAFNDGDYLNAEEQQAMKDCCEMFVDLLQINGLSEEGYYEVDTALTSIYTDMETRVDED